MIHLLTLAALVLAQDDEKGFEKIFNGKDLGGWKFFLQDEKADPAKTFSVTGGEIVCTGSPSGYLYTEKAYKEFTLRFEWRYARPADLKDDADFKGNSGYLLFIKDHHVWPKSLEIQGMNLDAGKLIPIQTKAKGKTDEDARKKAIKSVGEWNAMEIKSSGGKIDVSINGTHVTTVTDFDLGEGVIGFQSEGAEIHWRNIRIKGEK